MPDLRLLFWNLRGRVEPVITADVCDEYQPDILILSEASLSEAETVPYLNDRHQRFTLTINESDDVQFYVTNSIAEFRPMYDGGGIAARHVRPVVGASFILVATHLPSKLHTSDVDQALLATRLGRLIRDFESREGHERTVLIGDLNMNPFDAGVAASEGLHAVATRAIAGERKRTVRGEDRPFLYNPMWSLFGDDTPGPPGTYFYRDSAPTAFFWHMFDQVLLRPELAGDFRGGDVRVIEQTRTRRLLSESGRPTPSDHLPLLATIRLQEEDNLAEELVG